MVNISKSIFADEDVSSQILGLLRGVGRYIVFIIPYISLWGHAKTAISLAKQRGISIIFLVRADKDIVGGPDVK